MNQYVSEDWSSTQSSPRLGDDVRIVRAGFIPLVDCAVLAVAAEKGFGLDEGIDLQLVRETSWANIRDRINLGHLDCAQMLAGMPLASSLGIGHVEVPMTAPFMLGLNGNAITVSKPLYEAMSKFGFRDQLDPKASGLALKQVIEDRKAAGLPPLTFGMVFPFSCHNYELRYWMAAAEIHGDQDVRLVVIPPPLMVESLQAGHIDGFCVGEPWNSLAVDAGIGHIVTSTSQIWHMGPEKVLGARVAWADENPETLGALLRVLFRAAQWSDDPDNRDELADMLASPAYVGVDRALILRALSGDLVAAKGAVPQHVPDFIVFNRQAANFPWVSQAVWIYTQMVRWGQTKASPDAQAIARGCFRPDIYRDALRSSGLPVSLPTTNAKVEGSLRGETSVGSSDGRLTLGPNQFFDGHIFDPDDAAGYLDGFQFHSSNGISLD